MIVIDIDYQNKIIDHLKQFSIIIRACVELKIVY